VGGALVLVWNCLDLKMETLHFSEVVVVVVVVVVV
jgi:hypothetical protein